jgi:Uma2 family endonuclease
VELAMSVQLLRRKFTVEQYHKMVDSGILSEEDRVELIRGEIIDMAAIGKKHAAAVRRLDKLLSAKLQERAILDTQNPVVLDDTSEPQPDVALLRPREDFYETAHPQAEDIFLLIEVADSTVKYDREVKIPLYAENNIIEVWLVDVNQQIVEVFREPANAGYQNIQTFPQNQTLSIKAFPDVNITVNEIFGL